MNTPLRSLSGLIDFECAARWNSFRLAALELHKTPAAVSQQIKQLEQSLGFALFKRYPRHIVLTEKGRELADTASRVLKDLQSKVVALQESDDESILRVTTTHSFAMKWLVPRLHRFTEQFPELDIRIDSSAAQRALDDGSCDIALRLSRLDAADPVAIFYAEQLVVVHSPRLSADALPLSLAAVQNYPMLFDESPAQWLRYLQGNGLTAVTGTFSHRCNHAGLVVQAAVAGSGVALVQYALADDDVQQGRLCLTPGKPLASEFGYRFLCSPHKASMAKVIAFRTWLDAEISSMCQRLAAP